MRSMPIATTSGRLASLNYLVRGVSLAWVFFWRVVLGRLTWGVLAAALTLGWMSWWNSRNPEYWMGLQDPGKLYDSSGETVWNPATARSETGCIVVVHGLQQDLEKGRVSATPPWMTELAGNVQRSFASKAKHPPEICLVNWVNAAQPSTDLRLRFGVKSADFYTDVLAIRPQAEEVGELVAYKLTRLIKAGKIRQDQPFYLVGHSAGGFVVARVGLRLQEAGIAPENILFVILDTPMPGAEILQDLPAKFSGKIDFFVSSSLCRNTFTERPDGIRFCDIDEARDRGAIDAHKYAADWFRDHVTNDAVVERFGRGSFIQALQCGGAPR
jgi:hypothetical protein